MNKFIHPPDSLMGVVSLIFWISLLAGVMALLFAALAKVGS